LTKFRPTKLTLKKGYSFNQLKAFFTKSKMAFIFKKKKKINKGRFKNESKKE